MMMFNVEEQNILAVLHAETREATIADIRMVCRHTLKKLMKINDEEYAALNLEVDEGFAYDE